ncbi:NTF2 fold immunity protein [Myroides sp. DW712]|uniref:NTF2 fold immunity protein n=1 Tax=Myroides sp. DW712 TaxID=3389800 RepID=UPI00397CB009
MKCKIYIGLLGVVVLSCDVAVKREPHSDAISIVNSEPAPFVIVGASFELDTIQTINQEDNLLPTAAIAVQAAEEVLFQRYTKENIIEQRPYRVHLRNKVIWCVEGDLDPMMEGGVFYIELDKHSGAVLSVSHGK